MASNARDTKAKKRLEGNICGSRTERNERSRIAQIAATLIAEGLNDFRAAKRKAARQLGLPATVVMPDDTEVQSALRQHQSLFGDSTQIAGVRQLREVALAAMEHLAQFSPWLLGPILTDTATIYSDIELEIVGVEPKTFEMYLLDKRLDFDLVTDGSAHQDPATRYVISYRQHEIHCAIYGSEAARQTAASKTKFIKERARLAEVQARFADEQN